MKSNLKQRKCHEHDNKQVLFTCYNKFCRENRLVCKNCLVKHSVHTQDLIEDAQIKEIVQDSQLKCKLLIEQMDEKFNELTLLFRQFISSTESKFYLSIDDMNRLDNQQFNQYLNQLIIQDEQELNLRQMLEDGCQYFQDKIVQCQYELVLRELDYINIKKEDIEKAEIYYKLGYDYYIGKDYGNAMKQFDMTLDLNKNHLYAQFYKGDSLRCVGQYIESLEQYHMALQIDPKYQDALCGKAHSLRLLGKYIESLEWYDKALQIDPKYQYALFGKGDSLRLLGKYIESLEWYDKALQIDPKYQFALFGKGESLIMLKQYTQALEFLNSALQIDNTNSSVLASKGACLIELNNLIEAEICLNTVIQLQPNHKWVKDQLIKLKDKKSNYYQ